MEADVCGSNSGPSDAGSEPPSAPHVVEPGCGTISVLSGKPGTVVEAPLESEDGRRVDSRPPSGGRAGSKTDGSHSTPNWRDPLRGRANEDPAVEVLVQVLRDKGAN